MSIVLVGSTSGSITLQEPAVAGTTVLTLPAVTGNVLTDTSPKAGNVIQVVQTAFTTYITNATASGAYVDISGFSASITPTSATSKILVSVGASGVCANANNNTLVVAFLQVADASNNQVFQILNQSIPGGASGNNWGSYSASFLHSPATTLSFTYKVRYKMSSTGIQINNYDSTSGTLSHITLMEIAA